MNNFLGVKNVSSDSIARLMEIKHGQEVEIGVLHVTQKHLKSSVQSLQLENRNLTSEVNTLRCALSEALRDSSLLQSKIQQMTRSEHAFSHDQDNSLDITRGAQLMEANRQIAALSSELQRSKSDLSELKHQLQQSQADMNTQAKVYQKENKSLSEKMAQRVVLELTVSQQSQDDRETAVELGQQLSTSNDLNSELQTTIQHLRGSNYDDYQEQQSAQPLTRNKELTTSDSHKAQRLEEEELQRVEVIAHNNDNIMMTQGDMCPSCDVEGATTAAASGGDDNSGSDDGLLDQRDQQTTAVISCTRTPSPKRSLVSRIVGVGFRSEITSPNSNSSTPVPTYDAPEILAIGCDTEQYDRISSERPVMDSLSRPVDLSMMFDECDQTTPDSALDETVDTITMDCSSDSGDDEYDFNSIPLPILPFIGPLRSILKRPFGLIVLSTSPPLDASFQEADIEPVPLVSLRAKSVGTEQISIRVIDTLDATSLRATIQLERKCGERPMTVLRAIIALNEQLYFGKLWNQSCGAPYDSHSPQLLKHDYYFFVLGVKCAEKWRRKDASAKRAVRKENKADGVPIYEGLTRTYFEKFKCKPLVEKLSGESASRVKFVLSEAPFVRDSKAPGKDSIKSASAATPAASAAKAPAAPKAEKPAAAPVIAPVAAVASTETVNTF